MNPLAFVAIRGGRRGLGDDLLEIAVARTEPYEAQPTDMYTAPIRPLHGGGRDDDATWFVDAMDRVRVLTAGCVLVAWDAAATHRLLDAACYHWQLLPLDLAPRSIDLRSLAWPLAVASKGNIDRIEDATALLGIEFTPGACALEDIHGLTEIYRRVVKHARSLARFEGDERAILDTLASRLAEGRNVYGPWRVDDGRNNPREALAEVMDALNYCAAELVRLSKGGVA